MKVGLGRSAVGALAVMIVSAATDHPWRTALAGLLFGFLWALWVAHP